MRVSFCVNGRPSEVDDVWEGESLLFMLRERLGLWGSKNACEQGECGSCSVMFNGQLVCACLVAAGQAEGADVVTIEGTNVGLAGLDGPDGLNAAAGLSAVQEAYLQAGAVQCGFCTPGLVLATQDLLDRNPLPSDAEIREALAGNLCRCTGYEKILEAVRLAAALSSPGPGEAVPRARKAGK